MFQRNASNKTKEGRGCMVAKILAFFAPYKLHAIMFARVFAYLMLQINVLTHLNRVYIYIYIYGYYSYAGMRKIF